MAEGSSYRYFRARVPFGVAFIKATSKLGAIKELGKAFRTKGGTLSESIWSGDFHTIELSPITASSYELMRSLASKLRGLGREESEDLFIEIKPKLVIVDYDIFESARNLETPEDAGMFMGQMLESAEEAGRRAKDPEELTVEDVDRLLKLEEEDRD